MPASPSPLESGPEAGAGFPPPAARWWPRRTPAVRMVPDRVVIGGRRMRFGVSDNEGAVGPEGPGSAPLWAVNVHGYFAGGGMYWRESARLAATFGWRVLNPSLPGFAGSDALAWEQVNIRAITAQVTGLLDHLGVDQALFLGHSMGGAVAVEFAARHPERTLGIVYRDGAATPAWRKRRGPLVRMLGPFLPDVASVADLLVAAVLDVPDLFVGRRLSSTVRRLWPEARRNLRSMGRTLPVGAMLMALDMRAELAQVAAAGIPLLGVWGCFDRICTPATAEEFRATTGRPVQWVPGGHSWMLPRPQAQADVLRYLPSGQAFLREVEERRRRLGTGGRAQAAVRVLRS